MPLNADFRHHMCDLSRSERAKVSHMFYSSNSCVRFGDQSRKMLIHKAQHHNLLKVKTCQGSTTTKLTALLNRHTDISVKVKTRYSNLLFSLQPYKKVSEE